MQKRHPYVGVSNLSAVWNTSASSNLVLVTGLEPVRIISPRDFKSLVSAKSTTPANFGDPDGNRTRVTAVKGRCLNRLTTGPNW